MVVLLAWHHVYSRKRLAFCTPAFQLIRGHELVIVEFEPVTFIMQVKSWYKHVNAMASPTTSTKSQLELEWGDSIRD